MADSIDIVGSLSRYCRGSRTLAWLILANTVLSLLLMLCSLIGGIAGFSTEFLTVWFALPGTLNAFLTHPWTLLTYMFVQFSILHLLFNLIWLFWFGAVIVDIRPRSILPLYIGGGLAGGIAFLLVCILSEHPAFLAGSSASALAIIAAAAILAPDMEMRFFLIGNVKLKWFAPACILLALLGGAGNAGAFAAHIGGALFGVLYALSAKKHFSLKTPSFITLIADKKVKAKQRRRQADPPSAEGVRNFSQAASGRLCDAERLDALLDKIRVSGYSSLSDAERFELEALSKRLK